MAEIIQQQNLSLIFRCINNEDYYTLEQLSACCTCGSDIPCNLIYHHECVCEYGIPCKANNVGLYEQYRVSEEWEIELNNMYYNHQHFNNCECICDEDSSKCQAADQSLRCQCSHNIEPCRVNNHECICLTGQQCKSHRHECICQTDINNECLHWFHECVCFQNNGKKCISRYKCKDQKEKELIYVTQQYYAMEKILYQKYKFGFRRDIMSDIIQQCILNK